MNMEIEIRCTDEEVYNEQYIFTITLPKNTKFAKIRFDTGSPNADTAKQIMIEEIEFYEDKSYEDKS